MPLPTDEKLIALSEELIATFDEIFGLHPGFRPAHAKGVLADGNVYAGGCCGEALEGSALCAGVDAGDGAVFGFDGAAADSG